ncbi:hypothetical protein I4U23_025483 [Adineta vaga]|nr:hypothetical protein I4U23_025483 [Adineta vaga]
MILRMNPNSSNYVGLLTSVRSCIFTLRRKHYLRRFFILFVCIFVILFSYTIYNQQGNDIEQDIFSLPTHIFYTNISIYKPLTQNKQPSYQLVLLWTDLFNEFYWHQPLYFNSSIIVSCSSMYQCQFTRNKNRLSQSSIVAFHLYDSNRYRLPDRTLSKNTYQKWVFVTGESPINFYYQNPSFSPRMLDNYFDQSISYKYDSPYSVFSPIIKSRIIMGQNFNRSQELNRMSLKYKNKSIVWIVSNCNTFSQREKYVEELKNYISIDIYGKCGQSCFNRTCQINLHEYYFYLSFENSRCNSYITEKFWNIISDNIHRLVPIVMGAPENNYKRIAPNQSYIHVDKFPTPKDLAVYLHYLINHPEKYLEYLKWRESYVIDRKNSQGWNNMLCPLCQMAYERQIDSKTRINFSTWYEPKLECHSDDVQVFKQCKQVNLRDWMAWIYGRKCP